MEGKGTVRDGRNGKEKVKTSTLSKRNDGSEGGGGTRPAIPEKNTRRRVNCSILQKKKGVKKHGPKRNTRAKGRG